MFVLCWFFWFCLVFVGFYPLHILVARVLVVLVGVSRVGSLLGLAHSSGHTRLSPLSCVGKRHGNPPAANCQSHVFHTYEFMFLQIDEADKSSLCFGNASRIHITR